MISFSFLQNMNVESFSNAWKSKLSCEECSIRLNVFRKKKICFFCKNSFCQVCIMRREDKKFCCRKCQILTARPLNRNELLNLRSRDLVNYLTSRHISTSGCVEKEDLVNVLMRAVDNSCYHSSSNALDNSSLTSSYSNTPTNHSCFSGQSNTERRTSHSVENLFNEDGIRIIGHDVVVESDGQNCQCSNVDAGNTTSLEVNEAGESSRFSSEEGNSLPNQPLRNDEISETTNAGATSDKNDQSDNSKENNKYINLNRPLVLSDIKTSSDLDALSVKQLKQLLTKNQTDFKGCVEKTELLQKANRLWSDYVVSRKELDKLSLDELCKICMDAPIECVLLECGHMATCVTCGKQLCECPICRQFIVRCVRTFKA